MTFQKHFGMNDTHMTIFKLHSITYFLDIFRLVVVVLDVCVVSECLLYEVMYIYRKRSDNKRVTAIPNFKNQL